ncbi:TraR/DksA family transcriptional regulator [Paraburkholderia tropica]|uniref:TraR/DksA family transcriptional regulator n=1 Tax=Paraburkholderia tropica TaxID=92647 RepID=UPI0007ECE860|nr:TraR/DksA family transcriptional regulator [Paraburkholderia tropica]MBB2982542.1 DnaK suppressor protein [Paraburkholderia tropica]OBR52039.1 conjugal transfer protein TraR [Paraburkholderia tropica]
MTGQTLSAAFIEEQRKRLLEMQRDVLGSEENTIGAEGDREEATGAEAEEYEDDAQKMEQDIANQALRNVNQQRIADIQRALEKIADGTYGFSDESGDPIPIERLKALPEAVVTVQEQSVRDARQ